MTLTRTKQSMRIVVAIVIGLMAISSAFSNDVRIVVLKKERQLAVFRGETELHNFRVGLGAHRSGTRSARVMGRRRMGHFTCA